MSAKEAAAALHCRGKLWLLCWLLWTSTVDAQRASMYRCSVPGGGSSFQDRPCAAGASGKALAAADVADPAALGRWLREQQRTARPATGAKPPGPALVLPGEALPPHLMAACSTRFYDCAHADGVRMQRCLGQVPLCTTRRSTSCCPALALERFRSARAQGATAAEATRSALLGAH